MSYYRATGDPASPWDLARTETTNDLNRYATQLPAGTYRIVFNEVDDGTLNWTLWRPTTRVDTVDGVEVNQFTIGPGIPTIDSYDVLEKRVATLTGRLTTSAGDPAGKVQIRSFDASKPGDEPMRYATSAADGTYSISVPPIPTKIQVNAMGPRLTGEWLDDAPSFANAKTFTLADKETSVGNDAVLAYVPAATVSGKVVDPDGKPVTRGELSFYRSVDGIGAPYQYADSAGTHELDAGQPNTSGTYSVRLEPGRYAIRISPSNAEGGRLTQEYYGGAATLETSATIDQVGADLTLPDIQLDFSGGLVSGRVTDVFNKPVRGAEVTSYSSLGDGYPLATTKTAADGTYTIRGGGGKVRLWFLKSTSPLRSTDLGDLSVPPGTTLAGQDVVMRPSPIRLGSKPTITGTVKVGKTLRTTGGTFYPTAATKKYQWLQVKGDKVTPIRGATKSYFKPGKKDYGKKFRVTVTASYPTVTSKSATSNTSRALLHMSSVSLSGSSPSRNKVTLSAKVKVSDGIKPSGRVTFSCAGVVSKRVTLKGGRASATLSMVPSGRSSCRVSYPSTSTVAGSSRSKTITVKG